MPKSRRGGRGEEEEKVKTIILLFLPFPSAPLLLVFP
jgi:hypothetical protein